MTDRSRTDLPDEIADRITKPFARFLKIEAAAGALLFFAAFSALIVANTAWSTPYLAFWETPIGLQFGALDFTRSLQHWINDGLMTFFFFVISLELERELVLGELRNLRTAALPFAAALGGIVVPASIYLTLMAGEPGMHGWGTVMASDTAFVIGCLALFGSRIPPALRLFLLSLAIFDDVGAILVVADVGEESVLEGSMNNSRAGSNGDRGPGFPICGRHADRSATRPSRRQSPLISTSSPRRASARWWTGWAGPSPSGSSRSTIRTFRSSRTGASPTTSASRTGIRAAENIAR